MASVAHSQQGTDQIKKSPEDFKFGKVIGEGSFSQVILAKETATGKEYAIKVLDKRHIIKEKKTQYVKSEKEVLLRINDHPFFIRLHFTFQDEQRLCRGELLDYIKKLGCFDEKCTQFYVGEIVEALEYLHSIHIIHRDLKPENILLNDDMHIQITDFGSAKILDETYTPTPITPAADNRPARRNSFVGTAQYVSPEVLRNSVAYYSSDLWALGCITYQLLSGQHPFWGSHEYQIFQKITKLEYEFPTGFNDSARDLVRKLLVGLNEKHLSELLGLSMNVTEIDNNASKQTEKSNPWFTDDERRQRLEHQERNNEYHRFVERNLIIKQGFMEKRRGLFARRRMFLLTEGPRLFYVDPANMVLKGEIPWSKELRPEAKNFRILFVHTPNRIYYLEDPEGNALRWCKEIKRVWDHYYEGKSP